MNKYLAALLRFLTFRSIPLPASLRACPRLELLEERTVPSGSPFTWVRQFGGGAGSTYAQAVAPDGDVYVAGYVEGALPGQVSGGLGDAFVRKYDATGAVVWTRQFGSTDIDQVYGAYADSSGVYLAGSFRDDTSANGLDAFVRKYDPNGTLLWDDRFGDVGPDEARSIVADTSGVYIAGVAPPSNGNQFSRSGFVRKLDPDGNLLWQNAIGLGYDDQPWAVTLDASGLYVAGSTTGVPAGQPSPPGFQFGFLRKYDTSGNELWTRVFGAGDRTDAFGVTSDSSGLYVVGQVVAINGPVAFPGQTNSGGTYDAYALKYDTDGDQLWVRQFGTAGDDSAFAVAGNSSGISVAGWTDGTLPNQTSFGRMDGFVRHYNPDGTEGSTVQFGTSTGYRALAIVANATGVYVAGGTGGTFPGQTSSGGSDAFLALLGSGGSPTLPLLTSLSPTSVPAGQSVVLTILGTDFEQGDVVEINESATPALFHSTASVSPTLFHSLETFFDSSTQLRATLTPADLTGEGTASIRVRLPDGTTSAVLPLIITAPAPGGYLTFSTAAYEVTEKQGRATISVVRTGATGQAVTVHYATSPGSATAGVDYTTTAGTLSFAAGQTAKTFSVPIQTDSLYESDETVNLLLSSPTGGAELKLPTAAVLTIHNSTPSPTVSFKQASNSGPESQPASLTVTQSANSALPTTVSYTVTGGTAVTGIDFTLPADTTLTFNPGQTNAVLPITILNDGTVHPNRTLQLTLANPINATLGKITTETYTIINNNPLPTVSFARTSNSGSEATRATVAVTLSANSAFPVTINYAVTGGTATPGVDFKLLPGTLTFSPGQTLLSIPIPITNDNLYENNETIELTLSAPSNALLGSASHFVYTIVDNDPQPTVAFQQASSSGPISQNANLVVVLSGPSSMVTTVSYAVTGGTAVAGKDYTLPMVPLLTIAPGQTTAVIPITILDDGTKHPNRTLQLTLSNPVNANLGRTVVEIYTIMNTHK